MKLLLVAINAKYIHSNLAVYSLKSYAMTYSHAFRDTDGNNKEMNTNDISIREYTINHSEDDILKGIYREKAEVIAFSCYLWNIDIVLRIAKELKKIQPEASIWLGGPEVSYHGEQYLKDNRVIEGIMVGEGEQTFLELAEHYAGLGKPLSEINGLVFRSPETKEIIATPMRPPLNMDRLPFPYTNPEIFQNKIIYYESSRGCPYSCSYCLSSIDRRVRFRSTPLVKRELQILLEHHVPQIKFVDRTFNCNREHAMDIWSFIKDADNGITNFHFEISADLLSEEELAFLSTLRPGQVQFEIGVQTANPDTVRAIHRRMDLEKLSYNVKRLKEAANIHQHLDLIAGLPLEDYTSFERSFKTVYDMKPDQLQLGFLKVLKGSPMEEDCKSYGIIYRDYAPYEVLYTRDLSYEEIQRLKGICNMVEIYYNSGQFMNTIRFLEHAYPSPMKLYEELYSYYEEKELELMAHSRITRYKIILDFYIDIVLQKEAEGKPQDQKERISLFQEILLMDLLLREELKNRPAFLAMQYEKKNLRILYDKYRKEYQRFHIEQFTYHIEESVRSGTMIKEPMLILFDYNHRDPISSSATCKRLSDNVAL